MAEDGGCIRHLAQAKRPDCFNAVLFFVGSVLITKVLLYKGRLELSVHELEVLSHLICIHLLGNHFEQILVALDGKLGCRIRPKQSLQ